MSQHNSGMDYLGESNSSVSFPVTFLWPYGGRNVYLCGSFNAWQQYPMMPVELEGRPTAFQITCRLPLGHHEYKFLVDGEWRYDEDKTYISGKYGIVNVISSTTEHDYLAPFPSPQTTHTPDIDVQTEVFQHLHIQPPGGSLCETFPGIPVTDMQISRRHILDFLSTHTAYELMPTSGKVIALDVDLPVKQAFHILLEQGISIAPLFDFRKGRFTGILSALDFILIMKELRSRGYNMKEEDLEGYTISAWKEAKSYLSRETNNSGRVSFTQLVQAGPDVNLLVVALNILQNRVSVLPVLDYTPLDGGAYPHLLHLISLSDILEGICRHFRFSISSLPVLPLPISAIHLGTWAPTFEQPNRRPLAMLRPNASLIDALDLLVQDQVSSIPIVDDNGVLLNVYSRSDITSLAEDNLFARINLNGTTIYQAIQLRDELFSSLGRRQQRYHICFPTDPLYTVLERLSKPGVRRLVIVEAGTKRVLGIVSVSDVFRFFISDCNSCNSRMKF